MLWVKVDDIETRSNVIQRLAENLEQPDCIVKLSTGGRFMSTLFVALLTTVLLQTPVDAAEKIRISTPGDSAHFIMHLAQKRGFLKEEGFDAELITISGPVAKRRAQ
jgi:hypothetical protein